MGERELSPSTWPIGGGETAALIRALDWSQSPLGPLDDWPPSLRVILDLILASSVPMVVLWGSDLIQLYNDGFARVVGAKHPKAMGQSVRECWPETWHINAPIYERVLKGETVALKDQLIPLARDGSPADAPTICCSPIHDETGAVGGIFVTVSETAERFRAGTDCPQAGREQAALVQELAAERARFVTLIENLPFGAGLCAKDGHIVLGNPELRRILPRGGAPSIDPSVRAEWIGYAADGRILSPSEYPVARALRGEVARNVEFLHLCDDGSERWMSVSGIPIRDSSGEVYQAVAVVQDVDERKRAEHALRESEERFRQFAENSTSVLWIANVDTREIEYLSPAFERIWGLPLGPRRYGTHDWAETIHPEDRDGIVHALERVSQQGEVVVLEYRIVRPDRSVRWIRDTSFPIRDETGIVRRIGGIAQDVTMHNGSLVYVVIADDADRNAVTLLLRSAGYEVQEFSSAKAFLAIAPALMAGCVLLDVRNLEPSGLSISKELKSRRVDLPVIVVNRGGDVRLAVEAMKAGAVDFLEAPYDKEKLLTAIASAIAEVGYMERDARKAAVATAHIADMSSREREVLDRILIGGSNKTIGKELGISPRTVEVYRKRVMEKLGAQNLPEAVRMAFEAGLKPPPTPPLSNS